SMPRSAMALPISGASVTPRVASGRSRSGRVGLLQLDLAWRRRESVSIRCALLTALGAGGEAHGLVGGLEQRARLAHALGLLALGHRIGNHARAGLHIHDAILHHRGPEHDAAIHLAVGGEITDAARIRTARLILELVDDLHGAHLGRSR